MSNELQITVYMLAPIYILYINSRSAYDTLRKTNQELPLEWVNPYFPLKYTTQPLKIHESIMLIHSWRNGTDMTSIQ